MTTPSPLLAALLMAMGIVAVFGSGLLLLRLAPEKRRVLARWVAEPLFWILVAAAAATLLSYQHDGTLLACGACVLVARVLSGSWRAYNRSRPMSGVLCKAAEIAWEMAGLAGFLIAVGVLGKLDEPGWLAMGAVWAAVLVVSCMVDERPSQLGEPT